MNTSKWFLFAGLGWTCIASLQGCNDVLGTNLPLPPESPPDAEQDPCAKQEDTGSLQPVNLLPLGEATVSGKEITFEWAGGAPPYQLEIAYDAQFERPVRFQDPAAKKLVEGSIISLENKVTIRGLNGGYIHWRVRSLDMCASHEYTNGGRLHVTCAPVLLAKDSLISYEDPTIAWNPRDRTYGVVMVRHQPDTGKTHLDFLRTDEIGNILSPARQIELDVNVVEHPNPDVAYISSANRWAVTFQHGTDSRASVVLLDNDGGVIARNALVGKNITATHGVSYHADVDRIVTMTEATQDPIREPVIQVFDGSFKPKKLSYIAEACGSWAYQGLTGVITTIEGWKGNPPSAFAAFDFMNVAAGSGGEHRLFVQRIDLTKLEPTAMGSGLAWGNESNSCFKGVSLEIPVEYGFGFMPALAWNSEQQVLGLAYALRDYALPEAATTNVYFALVDPHDGKIMTERQWLNTHTPKSAIAGMPDIAWDGVEFLVAWNDKRDSAKPRAIQMRKFMGGGDGVPTKAQSLADALDPTMDTAIAGWSGKSIVGHDEIHTLVMQQRKDASSTSQVWMCIEPPY